MRCKKCGAEVKEGNVYCSVCGNEVQLVPEYNLLDEDLLGNIVVPNSKNTTEKLSETGNNKPAGEKKRRHRKLVWLISGACLLILIAVPVLYIRERNLQNYRWNSYAYQMEEGEASLSAGDFDNALLYYERALELRPKDKKARDGLLKIYMDTGKEAEAVSFLEEWITDNTSDQEAVKTLIGMYDENEEYDKILALYKKVENSGMQGLFADYLVEQPEFSSVSGTYPNSLKVWMYSKQGYDIFYTTDDSDPVLEGISYQESILLDQEGTTVIRAAARNEKGIYSEVAEVSYTIRYEPPSIPSVAPSGGTYEEAQMITVDVPADCTAYYTWDGSDPTVNSAKYTGPLQMPEGNQVLSVILVDKHGLKSRIYRVNYVYMPL